MNADSLSLWDRAELALLRLLSAALTLVDELLNVRWGERLLERLAQRWRTQLEQLNAEMTRLEQERRRLQSQAETLAIYTAAIYLGGRSLVHGPKRLRFDPADPHDEEILDASIELLVKQRLASIETEEIEAGHYVYHLEPDWAAIRARLSDAAEEADPDIADWFREGLKFVDELVEHQVSLDPISCSKRTTVRV